MNRASHFVLVALTLVGLLPAQAALAHGPCGCLDPVFYSEAIFGKDAKIRVSGPAYTAYKVIFNPRPRDFGIAPDDLASAYRPDAPTVTVLSRPRTKPARNWSFRVPDVPPGVYVVLIFDGSEAGFHNTWDYIHVGGPASPLRRARPPAAPGRQPDKRDDFGGALLAGLAAGAALGVLGSVAYRRLRR
jgi:hypothetical protein